MRNLIDLMNVMESRNDDFDDGVDENEDYYLAIERIRYAFERIGLALRGGHPILYDPQHTIVRIETPIEGLSLKLLNRLHETGLADDYYIEGDGNDITVSLKIDPMVLKASIPDV